MSYADVSTEELYNQMQDDLYDGLTAEIPLAVEEALRRGQSPQEILEQGLIAAMDVVGVDFRDGVLFAPEVLLAANAMKAGLAILRPLLVQPVGEPLGTVVIGAVKGDLHDIGKGLVAMMLEGAGFRVVDLGVNVDAAAFVNAVRQHRPQFLAMSALLTTTMPFMRAVIEAVQAAGLRNGLFILVGGAPVTASFAREIEADGYGEDAQAAVTLARAALARE